MTRPFGLGLQSAGTSMEPVAVLSTAPASPTEEAPAFKSDQLSHPAKTTTTSTSASSSTTAAMPPDVPQHATAAQFSFGPATQQTVTTVTTTTTVSFPPLIIKPPRDFLERDLKQYPLAYTPTPDYLRKFCADYHGQPIHFHEEEDAQETVRRHNELQAKIQRHNGIVRVDGMMQEHLTPPRGAVAPNKKVHNIRASHATKRSTPPSIAEAAELASLQRRTKRPRSQSYRTSSELVEGASLHHRLAECSSSVPGDPAPVTPDTDAGSTDPFAARAGSSRAPPGLKRRRSALSRLRDSRDKGDVDADMADNEARDDKSRIQQSLYGARSDHRCGYGGNGVMLSAAEADAAAATTPPPVVEADPEPASLYEDRRHQNLSSILTSSQHDASLPSPSLSPITAAANLASRRNTFDTSFVEHPGDDSTVSGLDLDDDDDDAKSASLDKSTAAEPSVQDRSGGPFATGAHSGQSSQHAPLPSSGPTVMDIPTMVEAFDNIPEPMQSYLIYQFLRRCSKSTLQMVANVVNPALKCDPFNILPAELGLNITRFLDYKSMCRASQVSKRWRRLINSDEKAWHDLIHRDGFAVPASEVRQAIDEGWGWQFPGTDGHESDLGKRETRRGSDYTPTAKAILSDDEETTSSTVTTRQKRKSMSKAAGPSKRLKRRSMQQAQPQTRSNSAAISSARLSRLIATSQGPNCLAYEAMQVVPHPGVGLRSLENMHLFKSLYQRHYLIRKAWMKPDAQPQHLAFRAHHHHVVTCLLFDDDKILTGSDDAKINVYDTKTGALRNRLEGHEGGVWALQYEGNTLVSGSTDRSVRVWDIKSGRCLQVLQGHTSTVRCLLILKPAEVGTAADGSAIMMPKEPLIITGSRDSTLRIWKMPQQGDRSFFQAGPPVNDRDNPYFLRTLSGHHNSVRAIAAHGDTLVSGSYDFTLRVWQISTGDLVYRLAGHTQKVYSVVLDHVRNRCISGSMDNLVKVWDLQTGSCLFNLEGHSSLVGLLDLGSERLVSAAADSTLRIWDPETGACKATLSAHTGAITCFQHDGQKVISGSDRTLKMWNIRTGECIKDLLTDLTGVWQVRFDQRRCVAAVQRNGLTYIELLDFGAVRDGVPAERLGRRILVDPRGREIEDVIAPPVNVMNAPAA